MSEIEWMEPPGRSAFPGATDVFNRELRGILEALKEHPSQWGLVKRCPMPGPGEPQTEFNYLKKLMRSIKDEIGFDAMTRTIPQTNERGLWARFDPPAEQARPLNIAQG